MCLQNLVDSDLRRNDGNILGMNSWRNWQKPILINPLITFRFLFGMLMAVGAIRFMLSDWIQKLYVEPTFFFKFYGFEWITVPSETGCYVLYLLVAISALGIALGAFYRLSAIVFFVTFTYSELLDATNYLNHYYLVILLSFLLIFLPAHKKYSVDVWRKPAIKTDKVPAWTIYIIIFQLCCVYFFAGLAKLNPDWLFRAMPMAIWLPERTHIPILGYFFQFKETAYIFSYFGAFYDLTIWLFLLKRKTRPLAYVAVVVFHVLTKVLFNIGLFPMIMMTSTLIFFSGEWHEKVHLWIQRLTSPLTLLLKEKGIALDFIKFMNLNISLLRKEKLKFNLAKFTKLRFIPFSFR